MIWTIAKGILIFVALVLIVTIVSVVIWVVVQLIRWFRERRKHGN